MFLYAALPDPAAKMLWTHMEVRIDAIIKDPSGSIASVSLLIALWAASKGIGVTMAAMERCYELERGRAFYTRRPMAFGLTLMVSVLVFILVLLLPAGAAFKGWMVGQSEHISYWGVWIFDTLRGALAVAVVLLILAVFYHFGPGVRHRWQFLSPGSIFVLLMWILCRPGVSVLRQSLRTVPVPGNVWRGRRDGDPAAAVLHRRAGAADRGADQQ